MTILFDTLDEARDTAFSQQRSFISGLETGIGFQNRMWQGRPIATHIYKENNKYYLGKLTLADLEMGNHINRDNGLSGTSPTLGEADLEDVAAMAVTIFGGEFEAESGYRIIFQMWAADLEIPVFVRVANERYPWYEIFWEHTETDCREINRRTGVEECEIPRD